MSIVHGINQRVGGARPVILILLLFSLAFNLFTALNQIQCQSSIGTEGTNVEEAKHNASSSNDETPSRSVELADSTITASILHRAPDKSDDVEGSDTFLISGEEFPDANSSPVILYDTSTNETATDKPGIANESNLKSDNSSTNTTETSELKSSQDKRIDVMKENSFFPTTTSSQDARNATSITGQKISAAPKESPDSEENGSNEESDEEDDATTDDNGQNRDAVASFEAQFEPPKNISQYMDYIEKLFHDLRHQITDLFEPHIPQLIRTSQMVELSSSCSFDMLRMALALRQFEPWALRMIDSSGKVPEGIFEGSFTALGSYDECLNTVFQTTSHGLHTVGSGSPSFTSPVDADQSSASAKSNESDNHRNLDHEPPEGQAVKQQHTQGKYCLVTVSPFMPPKPPADKVERMFQEEANRRNYTRDDQFSRLSPMFYYMKFRIGVCIPSSCEQSDMDSISGALSSSLRLNITIPDCRVKQNNQPLTRPQLVGGVVFFSIVSLVLCATLVDCFKIKFKRIRSQELNLRRQVVVVDEQKDLSAQQFVLANNRTVPLNHDVSIRMRPASDCCNFTEGSSCKFKQKLKTHWGWLSFSLLTNFRLYFQSESDRQSNGNSYDGGSRSLRTIECLNGIRVLSLCWVIVANSYLTLDPRVTKRLAKTREAPRDLLFQLVVQASLAIETFFFLSGLLMSLSFAKRLMSSSSSSSSPSSPSSSSASKLSEETKPSDKVISDRERPSQTLIKWIHFYIHRYVRMTPPTMLVIALSMYAYHFGDGPLWHEATKRVHESCAENWWRHLLHVANFIDTRQMCFIHYWYIAADMQLFLFAPLVLFVLYKFRHIGYVLVACIASLSIGIVFYMTHERSLPPTLLFYSTDPESRREFGNTIMTKPFSHVLPYLVGMLLGWYLANRKKVNPKQIDQRTCQPVLHLRSSGRVLWTNLGGALALLIGLTEIFLPYQWNNSQLPGRLAAATYAALFRLGWSLVLAYIVMSCGHKRGRRCSPRSDQELETRTECGGCYGASTRVTQDQPIISAGDENCFCATGGSYMNRLLSLHIFSHLSKLSFVAYLIHLPLMSVFVGQTRGLFAFSHTLVVHLAISYLVLTFLLAFLLVHIIEFPFLTFERHLSERILGLAAPAAEHLKHSEPGTMMAMMTKGTGISGNFKICERL